MKKDNLAIFKAYIKENSQPPLNANNSERHEIMADNQLPLSTYRNENQEKPENEKATDKDVIKRLKDGIDLACQSMESILSDIPDCPVKEFHRVRHEKLKELQKIANKYVNPSKK